MMAPAQPTLSTTGASDARAGTPIRDIAHLRGGAAPKIVANPDGVLFAQPNRQSTSVCRGDSFYSCDREVNLCDGVCTRDSDCPGGETCYGATDDAPGTCLGSATCVLACGTASKTIELCNEGVADLHISNLEITGSGGGEAPKAE